MPRSGPGVYSLPAGSIVADGVDDILATQHNTPLNDLAADANIVRPVVAGGTGVSSLTGFLTTLGGQPLDAALTSISGLTYVADRGLYTTGVDVFATYTQTAFARTLLDDANQAAAQATLGLVPGTNVQAFDADLTALAALATTGLISRTGAGTMAARNIVSADTSVVVTNPGGVAGDINLSVATYVAAQIAAIPPVSTVFLGTITTTSGASQSLSGLTLTGYKFLRLSFNGVSLSVANNIEVNGNVVAIAAAAADTFRGIVDIDLATSIAQVNLANVVSTMAVAAPRAGVIPLTTASTSVTIGATGGTLDGGSVRVYGIP